MLGGGGLEAARSKLFRLKTVGGDFLETQLKRCLSTVDITLLGVGHMIGAGVYVLTGEVARNTAGPGIVLSFLLAGLASLLAALCYAEFGARCPKAGSAYTYAYVTVGELWAFVIGWNIILEHCLGAAAVARSWSGYLDSFFSHAIRKGTLATVGEMHITFNHLLGDYPDFVAFLLVVVVSVFMGLGAKSSTNFNTLFTGINLAIMSFIILYGFSFANLENWTGGKEGEGGSGNGRGFLPYGVSGVLAGAASCFFAYIGFDGMATSGEEAKDPGRSIPVATFIAMGVVTASYILMSSALTLMVPYTNIHQTSAFADAFESNGAVWAKYVVALGALSGMTTSLVGSLFALPRCVYAMANDGLIFRSLATIHPTRQTPVVAILVFGALTAIIALLFDIQTLVEFLSIGTLLAYTIVAASVIILRYQPPKVPLQRPLLPPSDSAQSVGRTDDEAGLVTDEAEVERPGRLKPGYAFLAPYTDDRFEPGILVTYAVNAMITSTFVAVALWTWVPMPSIWAIPLIFAAALVALGSYALICVHVQSGRKLSFRVPLVPFIPSISILGNIIFMLHLAPITWLRLTIWLAVGLAVYFTYGIKHSGENANNSEAGGTKYQSLVATPAQTPTAPNPPQPSLATQMPQPPSTN